MNIHESAENYLETILILSKSHPVVRSVDVASELGFKKSSVSRAMGLLKSGGYVLVDDCGHLTLTDAGRQIAEKIYERHTVLTKLLTQLGVDAAIAAEDACKIEHVISDTSFQALKSHAAQFSAHAEDAEDIGGTQHG